MAKNMFNVLLYRERIPPNGSHPRIIGSRLAQPQMLTTSVRIPVQSTAPLTMVQIAAEVELVTDLVIP